MTLTVFATHASVLAIRYVDSSMVGRLLRPVNWYDAGVINYTQLFNLTNLID